MKRYLSVILIGFCSLLFSSTAWAAPQVIDQFEEQYQRWADLCRIDAVHRIAKMIETVYARTGKYPFQGETNMPVEARLSQVPLQGEERYPPPGYSGIVLEWPAFYQEIARELGPSITIPLEPQKVPAFGHGTFLQFHMDHANYWVSAMLFRPTATTRRLSEYSHKYEVGSLAVPSRRIRRFKDIPSEEIVKVQQSLRGKRRCPEVGSRNMP